jgi:DNA polymerase type B, organellar and viral
MIKLKSYPINNLPLTNEILASIIINFWNEIFNSVKDTNHLLILCKVNFSSNEEGYRTLGHLRKVNFNDRELFIDYLQQRLGILSDSYISHPISNIIFSYIIKDGQCLEKDRALLSDLTNKNKSSHNFNNMNLPISMNPSDYGEVLVDNYVQTGGKNLHRFIVENGNKTYRIDVSNDGLINNVKIQGNIDLEWTDTKIGSDIFKREIKKSTIYFMDGEIVLRKQILPAKPFRRLQVDPNIIPNFYTMDIETVKLDRHQTPYLICAYNGSDYITSYGKDKKALFTTFFDQLLSKIESGSKTLIYAHNLSGFYGILIFKHLLSLGKVEPLLFNGKLITIKVTVKGSTKSENKVLVFKDSFLLLPLSLRKLCLAFDTIVPKGYLPFKLTNIFYTGVLPKFEYWSGISLGVYESLASENKGKFWSFQQEAIKYCKLDCATLHEIITKFNDLIFNEFKVDAHKALTLPALAMRIYKTHYMPKDTIYQLLGKPDINIRKSYTGGAVDVYIPHNRISAFFSKVKGVFTKLYSYDVNSLYPFIMATNDMPIGKPIAFEGDIRRVDPNAFGFFNCKITSPEYLEHPILQRKIKTSSGYRTIAALGGSAGTGWIFSKEMDNAMKYGYQFEILNGYEFEKGNIFKEYVLKLYNLRQEYVKGHAMNLIAKLLMNSLYGKFGMKLESTEIMMYDSTNEETVQELHEYVDLFGEKIENILKLDNYYIFIRKIMLVLNYNEELDMYHGLDVNIAIASAITAGARIHMSTFKNNPNFNLYYSDTDNAVIDQELPEHMVGKDLGQMKLEHIINKAVFLALTERVYY